MATIRQIEANRRNALNSTGPRSVEGKAVSRLNAFKTGIDAQSTVAPGEDAFALEELAAEYHERYRPSTPEARFLVDTLVNAEWQLRRLRKIEAQIWGLEWAETAVQDGANWLALAFVRSANVFTRLQRRIDAAERAYRRAMEKLELAESAEFDPAAADPLGPEGVAPAVTAASPRIQAPQHAIGFVPPAARRAPLDPAPQAILNRGCQMVKAAGPGGPAQACAPNGYEAVSY